MSEAVVDVCLDVVPVVMLNTGHARNLGAGWLKPVKELHEWVDEVAHFPQFFRFETWKIRKIFLKIL